MWASNPPPPCAGPRVVLHFGMMWKGCLAGAPSRNRFELIREDYMSTQRKRTSPAITRVLTLFEAISNLHTGDLLTVLDLDGCAPFIFEMDANCRRLKRKHSGQTGWDVASIIEEQLCWVLGFGEAFLPTVQKEATGRPLGGRTFKGGASLHRRGRLRQRRERISKE
jgi:hypothetical protein